MTGRAFADVDRDGDVDIVLDAAKYQDWLWLNDGSGLFTPVQQLTDLEERTVAFAFADLNQDGAIDLVAANRDTSNYVWLNDGYGYFVLTQANLGNSDARGLALGDLDGDGDLDLIFANANNTGNEVWLNDGSGYFAVFNYLGTSSSSVAIGDLDGDGDLDAVLAPLLGDGAEIWYNDGFGNFETVFYPNRAFSHEVDLADFDRDGDLDGVFANGLGGGNDIWLNDGAGTFTVSQSLGQDDSIGVKVADLDGDGYLDLVFANRLGRGNTIWFNNGSGQFTETLAFGKLLRDTDVRNLQVRDLDQDGDLDVTFGTVAVSIWFNQASQGMPRSGIYQAAEGIVDDEAIVGQQSQPAVQNPEQILVLSSRGGDRKQHNDCSTNAQPLPLQLTIQHLGVATTADIQLGDLDQDGDLDIVFANYYGERSQVWLNDGTGHFTLNQLLSGGYSFTVVLGDLNGDGALDMVLPKRGLNNEIWFNDGQGRFALVQSIESNGEDTRSTALGDLDGDGDLDIVFGTAFGEKIRVWLNDGSGFVTALPQSFGTSIGRVDRVALGDLDGDRDLDLVFINAFEEGNEVWLNNGDGYFSLAQADLGDAHSRDLALGDLDLDGDLDLIFANIAGHGNEIWLNDGASHFTLTQSLESYNKGLALGDWDNDGDLDVFLGESEGESGNSLWLNDGTGHLRAFTFITNTSAHAVALGDLNGDDRLDVVFGSIGPFENGVWFGNPDFGFPE